MFLIHFGRIFFYSLTFLYRCQLFSLSLVLFLLLVCNYWTIKSWCFLRLNFTFFQHSALLQILLLYWFQLLITQILVLFLMLIYFCNIENFLFESLFHLLKFFLIDGFLSLLKLFDNFLVYFRFPFNLLKFNLLLLKFLYSLKFLFLKLLEFGLDLISFLLIFLLFDKLMKLLVLEFDFLKFLIVLFSFIDKLLLKFKVLFFKVFKCLNIFDSELWFGSELVQWWWLVGLDLKRWDLQWQELVINSRVLKSGFFQLNGSACYSGSLIYVLLFWKIPVLEICSILMLELKLSVSKELKFILCFWLFLCQLF